MQTEVRAKAEPISQPKLVSRANADAEQPKAKTTNASRQEEADPKRSEAAPYKAASQPAARSEHTAYILNLVLPGAGNVYFGQPILGAVFIVGILFGLFLLVFGTAAAMLGLMIIVVSIVAAFFTLGLSLLIGLPIGMILVFMGAGPIIAFMIWIFSLIVSEILVHAKVKRLAAGG